MELKKNEIYTAQITDYTTEGSGVCKINGIAVFVPSTAVGDTVSVKIVKSAKNYAYGRAEEIISPSNQRKEPDCAVFGKCGGCTFRHIDYSAELEFKQKRVVDTMTRIGGVDSGLIEKIIGAKSCNFYRNKAQLPVTADKNGKICVGFFAPRSHRVVPLDECHLQSKAFAPAIKIFLEWANSINIKPYDEQTHTGILRHLYLRYAEKTDELMVCIIANANELRHEKQLVQLLVDNVPNLKTVVLNTNTDKTNVIVGKKCRTLYGDGYITDELCGLKFRISPLSFYQVNRTQAERLYGIAAEYADLKSDETLIDMYCGTGTIGLTMAHNAKKLIGVEIIPQAIEDAKKNAKFNGIENAEFICADASSAAEALSKRKIKPDCIVLDPPRKGCDSKLISTISSMSPSRVVYVSCDPATLARDIKIFSEYGYNAEKITPVDLFPRTVHVECVVLLTKVHN
ncbi:MAG: 23S rRNA (uracil(1939)-C(5))-methyltransferase RlmD [Clostridia bacterium]|nr:23S rRNA (uracil(1939)-C(5))-methyltransferase RlmD [Clostridia bacterium]